MNTQLLSGKTAILYARASKKEQSTTVQLQQLEEFCKANNIKVIDKFDENISGAAEHREKLETILESEPMADLLIIREISRISRERDYINAINKVSTLANKYSIYVLLDDYYIEKGKLIDLGTGITMMVKLYGAADEREKIKDRTSTAMRKYRENSPINVISGSKEKPFGLKKVANPNFIKGTNTKSIYVPDENEWGLIMQLWELRSQGYSAAQIKNIVNIPMYQVRQAYESKVIRYYVEQQNKALYDAAIEAVNKNNRVPSPHKHPNKYKGKIFDKDTKFAFCHGNGKRDGSTYRAKGGTSGTIKEALIDDVVIRTIRCMLTFFDLKREELSKENDAKVEAYKKEVLNLMKTSIESAKQEETLNKKWLKAPNEAVEQMIAKEIENNRAERLKIMHRVNYLNSEINRLINIDYSQMNIVINENNLQAFIDKYITRIECWKLQDRWMKIKVFVNEAYIPSNFYPYKQYKVHTWRNHTVEPIHIEDAVNTSYYRGKEKGTMSVEEFADVYGGGMFWDLKVYSLPYYTPEELEEKFGIKK